MQDKDVIELIRHIAYLKQQIKLRDRKISDFEIEIKQLKGENDEETAIAGR